MRSLATLLMLLLALPGLVLPAGFLWRVCRCAAATADTAAATPDATASCCAAHRIETPAPLPSTCCDHCCRAENHSEPGAEQLAHRGCKCVWLKVPDHQQKPVLPQQPPSPDVMAPPLARPMVARAFRDAGRRLPGFEVARPPPRDHHRSLPLLL